MPPDYASLLARLRSFVLTETELQRQRLQEQWARPLGERVAGGLAIEGLSFKSLSSQGVLVMTCSTNLSRFREGDFLVLHRGNPGDPFALRGVLEWDDDTELEITLEKGNPAWLRAEPHGYIADEDLLDLSPFYLEALDGVADKARGRERILPLLTGQLESGIDYARYERAWEAAAAAGLNDSQAEAAAMAYASDLVYLIQGPPGTGKTLVLAHLARLLVADGQRVLVTALTHRAINHALNKIAVLDTALPVCKIGQASRARELLPPNFENFALSGLGDLPGGYCVGATPFATQSDRLANVEFDVVLFDEASQVTLPLAMMGMLAGMRWVFIGDDRQLPPVTAQRASEFGRSSIFSYLSGHGWQTMLDLTYRMNDALTAWPSRTFYGGAIRPAPGVGDRRLQLANRPGSRWEAALDPGCPAVFIDLGTTNTRQRSYAEAELAGDLVLELIRARLPPAEIGVVTPYRAQARLIRSLLRPRLPHPAMLRELVVDTVERMQGQEREVVLVSLATSSAGYAARLAEFFFQPERLNVSVTRPRTKLIVLGSRRVLDLPSLDDDALAGAALLRDLLDSCTCLFAP